MNSWNRLGPTLGVIRAQTIEEAGTGLRMLLATGLDLRTIKLSIDPTGEEIKPWLEYVRSATPQMMGMMVQRLFARVFVKAGYDVVVGTRLDLFARSRLRSLFVEVKSSRAGGMFGSQAEMIQLDGYLIASERRRAERWLGTTGIEKPMKLREKFRAQMRRKNIGLIDIAWVSPRETLLSHLSSVI